MLKAIWQKNTQNNEWFDFFRLDIDSSYFDSKEGVYVVWAVSPPSNKVIKVGSGNLREEFKNLKSDPSFGVYTKMGPIKVSWVAVNGVLKSNQMNGVESYLQKFYNPLISNKTPADPIEINIIGQ